MSKEKETYLEHLENKVEDLQLENELLLIKLREEREKLDRIKKYIFRKATYKDNVTSIDDIEGIFSTDEIKDILYIIEGALWIEKYGLYFLM